MNLYFTSDTHFDHETALKWRPFDEVEEMNEVMIQNWNATVSPKDIVHHMGDVGFFRDIDRAYEILHRLNGQKFLTAGNHDSAMRQWHKRWVKLPGMRSPWVTLEDVRYISGKVAGAPDQKIVLCHYPMVTWQNCHHGSWMVHGHCHGNLDESRLPNAKRIDAGVDPQGYYPISYDEVDMQMRDLHFDWIDHHKGEE